MGNIPLLHDKDPQVALIFGKCPTSGNFSQVIGGTMTAGTWDDETSSLITWAPPFISAPILIGTLMSGGLTTTSPVVRFSGVGVSNAYVTMGETALANTGATISILAIGRSRL